VALVFKDPRKAEYLNAEGAGRPLRSPIPPETLAAARAYRKRRMVEQVVAHDCAAILLYDPINIRYALDVSNMQVWAGHSPIHSALVFADGHAIDFEYQSTAHLAAGLETVDEVRPALAWFYMYSGEHLAERVGRWAAELVAMLRGRAGAGELRLAVDKLDPPGVDALRRNGVVLVEGQELTEHARLIKSAEEIELMRWTIRVCETGMARMYEESVAGRTEQEIWAELHHENIRSGGEWIETRLCVAGERTNPWYQECSDHVAARGDMLAFDTDMIGPYGYCADLSRSWTIDHVPMTGGQRALYSAALEQIEHNVALIAPGLDFREYSARSWPIPDRYLASRYSCLLHGVGLADEYPGIYAPQDASEFVAGRFEPGMVLCAESLVAEEGGREAVKLETQVLVTETGAERLDSFPWEDG
jgi:Xaa-Pro aminopeptidase